MFPIRDGFLPSVSRKNNIMANQRHTKFPMKKCIIMTMVLLIVYSIVLTLLLSISKNRPDDRLGFILMVVSLSLFLCFLVGYWIYQVIRYIGIRKDEK